MWESGRPTKSMKRVNAGKYEGDDKFGRSFSREVFSGKTNATEVKITEPHSSKEETKLFIDREESKIMPRFLTASEIRTEVLSS